MLTRQRRFPGWFGQRHVGACEDVAPGAAPDFRRQPLGAPLATDTSWPGSPPPTGDGEPRQAPSSVTSSARVDTTSAVTHDQPLQAVLPGAADCLGSAPDNDVPSGLDLPDQVVGHATPEGLAADQHGHFRCVLGQVHGRLARRFPAPTTNTGWDSIEGASLTAGP